MKLVARTAVVLWHPDGRQVLLLRRSAQKKLFPNLITGVGGKVEFVGGEGDDLAASLWREFLEETRIPPGLVTDLSLELATLSEYGGDLVVLLWFTGRLKVVPEDLRCSEGQLQFYPVAELPLAGFIPDAAEAISFVLGLCDGDCGVHLGLFTAVNRLVTE